MKVFLKAIVDKFEIGPDAAYVAITAYSTSPQVMLKFNDPANKNSDKAAVNREIARLPHQRGFTFIDKALKQAASEVFSRKGGVRGNVPQVIFVPSMSCFESLIFFISGCKFLSTKYIK